MKVEQRSSLLNLQKRIAVIIASLVFIICIMNFITGLRLGDTVMQSLIHPTVSALLLFLVIFLVTGSINRAWARIVQIILGYLYCFITILSDSDGIFGIGLFLVFSIIAFKYGFFKKKPRIKLFLGIIAVYLSIIFSASRSEAIDAIPTSINSILYISIFLIVLYMIYMDDINEYVRKAQAAEESVSELLSQRVDLENQLKDLNSKIEYYNSRNQKIDFSELNITEREQDVIWALVVYQDKQKDIAKRLNISPETVKTHLKHIRDKLGVDRQTEIIEMCRNNFLMEDKKT